jgi:hypothetical protein
MARGWESKSVQSQIEDQRNASVKRPRKKSAEEMEREHQHYSLELSRRRIVSELKATKSALRRTSLEAALQHLDAELSKLDSPKSR